MKAEAVFGHRISTSVIVSLLMEGRQACPRHRCRETRYPLALLSRTERLSRGMEACLREFNAMSVAGDVDAILDYTTSSCRRHNQTRDDGTERTRASSWLWIFTMDVTVARSAMISEPTYTTGKCMHVRHLSSRTRLFRLLSSSACRQSEATTTA